MSEFAALLLGAGVFINALITAGSFVLQLRQHRVIAELEKNTNSIKDALIKTTAEAEHAKGVLVGKAELVTDLAILKKEGI